MDKREKILNEIEIYSGKVVKLSKYDVICPNGNLSERELVKHNGGALVLGIKDNKILMIKQYRFAYDKVLLELPAGKLEKNEDPKAAAFREFEEETGYKALNMFDLGVMYPSCGYSNEKIYMYYTTDFSKTAQHLDEDELIDVYEMDIDTVLDMIDRDEIRDAKTICAISKYDRIRKKLRI